MAQKKRKAIQKSSKSGPSSKKVWMTVGISVAVILVGVLVLWMIPSTKQALFGEAVSPSLQPRCMNSQLLSLSWPGVRADTLRSAREILCTTAGCTYNKVAADPSQDSCTGLPTSCPNAFSFNFWSNGSKAALCSSVSGINTPGCDATTDPLTIGTSSPKRSCVPVCTNPDNDNYCTESRPGQLAPPAGKFWKDNCPNVANNPQRDSDRDGIGDACEPGTVTGFPSSGPTR